MSRGVSALLGAMLVAAGVAGLNTVSLAIPAPPEVSQRDVHQLMHEMMEDMHGPGTVQEMHQVPGAEEMMDQCAAMRSMMEGGRMDRMMEMMGMMGG
ncbi:MAG: hypothetical protein ACRDGH_16145 [Candidatus Limnocylindria bacterium]